MARVLFLVFAALLLYACAAASPSQRNLVVHPNEFSSFAVPRRHSALGVEFLNHELYGGLSTQMVFGESFEEASLASKARLPCLVHVSLRPLTPAACQLRAREGFTPPPSDIGFIGCAGCLLFLAPRVHAASLMRMRRLGSRAPAATATRT